MDATEDLYCAEQISIPPTFPYLLRQYAKAAIRTQPVDLLKWSTTYFRCLSLNCPPPVKTRLEYPIPDDWHGLTPGWVKSLYLQIHPSCTVEFKVLWDRWMGSCLEHEQLIQVLCLGGFKDPSSLPWLKFIGLCASMISGSLTQTMIMVCEILTEEPDGASASITIENFLSIYKFLAAIDASKDQWLKNKYFTDSLLGLWKEKREKFEEEKKLEESEEEGDICSEPAICETVEKKEEEGGMEITKEVSCPSIKENDYQKIEDYLEAQEKLAEAQEEEMNEVESDDDDMVKSTKVRTAGETTDTTEPETEYAESTQDTDEMPDKDKNRNETMKTAERQALADMDERQKAQYEKDKLEGKDIKLAKKKIPEPQEPDFEEKGLLEDLAKLKALQEEMRGEDDNELEEFKQQLMRQLEKTPSELEAISHFAGKLQDQDEKVLLIVQTEDTETKSESVVDIVEEEDDSKYEDIFVTAKPGIGPKVPEDLVKEIERYMKEMAKVQHGMVMPRNIRHYDCPPLEEVDDLEKEIKFLDADKK
ncbi:caldesmon-like [Harmonia axyridis]|uniref:caldesmon-like n=1 Tax=Harmonia axyridis TaxID=115357 RepID=UPI001E2789D0|nr:caldesmon-like [Harmonia axyridis]